MTHFDYWRHAKLHKVNAECILFIGAHTSGFVGIDIKAFFHDYDPSSVLPISRVLRCVTRSKE